MRFVFRLSQAYFFPFDFLSKSDLTMDHFSAAKYFSSARSKNIFFRFFSSGRFALCLPHPDFIRHRKPADKLEPSVKSTPSLGMRFLLLDLLSTLDHYLVSKDFGKSFHLIQIIGLIPFCLISDDWMLSYKPIRYTSCVKPLVYPFQTRMSFPESYWYYLLHRSIPFM